MYKAIIDASALLAFLKEETVSTQELESLLPKSIMSSVNACEVATVLTRLGMPLETIEGLLDETVGEILPFDKEIYLATAHLWHTTKPYGLSLGDRACLAVALQMRLPVYTADKIWSKLKIENLKVNVIR